MNLKNDNAMPNTETAPTIGTYARVWAALMVLLGLTIFAAHYDLGDYSLVVALIIAVAKALFIILFFMHVRYGKHQVLVFACAAYIWLAILIVGTLHDYLTRNWVPGPSRPQAAAVAK